MKENRTYTNGFRIELTLSHRYANFLTKHNFPNYKEAREYCDKLREVSSVLNGYTLRRFVILPDGSEVCAAVLMHRRFVPLDQCITGKPFPRPETEESRKKEAERQADFARIAQKMNEAVGNPYMHRGKRSPTLTRAERAFYE